MQVAKRRIKDKKFNSEVSEIKREKQETEEYHKQLVKRIKEEKEEKKRKREQQVSPPTSPLLPSQTPSLSPSKNYTTAMIRVRLLDGTTISKEFQAMDTLQTVKKYIDQTCKYTRLYYIKTNFPNHIFTSTEYSSTLQQLHLVPNATLIITEGNITSVNNNLINVNTPTQTTSNATSANASYFSSIMYHFSSITNYLWSFLGYTQQPVQQSQQSQPQNRVTTSRTFSSPKESNIHRLRSSEETDTKEGTWNGNSTQQL